MKAIVLAAAIGIGSQAGAATATWDVSLFTAGSLEMNPEGEVISHDFTFGWFGGGPGSWSFQNISIVSATFDYLSPTIGVGELIIRGDQRESFCQARDELEALGQPIYIDPCTRYDFTMDVAAWAPPIALTWTLPAVPLPAGGLLLLSAFGLLAIKRRA